MVRQPKTPAIYRDPYEGMWMSRRDMGHVYSAVRDANAYLTPSKTPSLLPSRDATPNQALRVLGKARETAAVGAGALGAGWIAGRLNNARIPGTPIPVGAGIAIAAWGLSAFFPQYLGGFAEDLHNAGNGAFASWLSLLGLGWGGQARLDNGEQAGPIVAGAPPSQVAYDNPHASLSPRGRALTEAEILALRHAA